MGKDRISSLICTCLDYNTPAVYFKLVWQGKNFSRRKKAIAGLVKTGQKPCH